MCLESHSAEVGQASESVENSIALEEAGSMPQAVELAISEGVSSPTLPPVSTEAPIKETTGVVSSGPVVSSGGLSEEDKHAGMKRRYSMLQQNLKLPAEEERRLKRERLRSLLPIWPKHRMDSQSMGGGANCASQVIISSLIRRDGQLLAQIHPLVFVQVHKE